MMSRLMAEVADSSWTYGDVKGTFFGGARRAARSNDAAWAIGAHQSVSDPGSSGDSRSDAGLTTGGSACGSDFAGPSAFAGPAPRPTPARVLRRVGGGHALRSRHDRPRPV